MHVDEIEVEPSLPGLPVAAGVGRHFLRGVRSGQQPRPTLQSVLVEIRRTLNEQTHGGCVEPDFDIAADLDIWAKRIGPLEEGTRQAYLKGDIRCHCALDRSQVMFLQGRHRNKQQVRVIHLDLENLIVVVAAQPPQLVMKGKRVAGLGVPDPQAGLQRVVRRSADFQIER
ncbi:MAG TPA: hypothetical protein VLE03_07990 [Nitrospiraceae bacterium]|nr:hypothetical protein [Nitrospiraceae bacterium]